MSKTEQADGAGAQTGLMNSLKSSIKITITYLTRP